MRAPLATRRALAAILAALATAASLTVASVPARAETMITSLSTHRVTINSSYTGAQLVIFGTIERDARTIARGDPYDLVMTVRGPRKTLVVRRKEPLGPVWINRSQRRFIDTPSFLAVASSRPVEEMAAADQRARLGLGLEALLLPRDIALELDDGEAAYRNALIRIENRDELFTEEPRGVTFLSPSLFRAPIRLPGVAPPGSYDVEVLLLAGGVVLSRQVTNFEVVTTGFEQRIKQIAQRAGGVYGLATVLLALFFGWLASVIFRRD